MRKLSYLIPIGIVLLLPALVYAVIGGGTVSGTTLFQLNGNDVSPNDNAWDLGIGTTTSYGRVNISSGRGTTTAAADRGVFTVLNLASTTWFTINEQGRVGIGTNTPGAYFSVGHGNGTTTALFEGTVDLFNLTIRGTCTGCPGVTGSGASGRVAFWNGASSLSSNASFLWTDAAARLSFTLGSSTDSFSIGNLLNVSGTGTSTFTGGVQSVGLRATGGVVLNDYATCTALETDASGNLKCGSDASAAVAIGDTITGGTTGSVLFVNAGPVLAQDNANFLFDDTNNRLGIGTSSPWGTLSVEHLTSNNPAYPAFVVSDLGTSTPSLIVLNQNGFVGIATRTPGTAFAVSGEALIAGAVRASTFIATSTTERNVFPIATTTSLSVGNLITVAGTGTSTFTGGVSTAGLSSSAGIVSSAGDLILTGGKVVSTGVGTSTYTGGLSAAALRSTTGGITSDAGDLLLTGGKIVSTGGGTSTYSGGVSSAGLASSAGLVVSTGDAILSGGKITASGTGTSTFTGGVSASGLASSNGLTLTGGTLDATNLAAKFGQRGTATSTVAIATSTPDSANVFEVRGDIFYRGQTRAEFIPMTDVAPSTIFDCAEGNRFSVTLSRAQTSILTPKNCVAGHSVILRIAEDATGGRLFQFSTSSTVNGQYSSTTANAVNWFGLIFYGNFGYILASTSTNPTN